MVKLARTPGEDLARLEDLGRRGDDLSRPVRVTHFFGLARYPGAKPVRAREEPEALGFEALVTEEVTGDGYWHVAAFGEAQLTSEEITRMRLQMEQLARRHQLIYHGWDRTLTVAQERDVSQGQ